MDHDTLKHRTGTFYSKAPIGLRIRDRGASGMCAADASDTKIELFGLRSLLRGRIRKTANRFGLAGHADVGADRRAGGTVPRTIDALIGPSAAMGLIGLNGALV
ncbi:MAG: hypothetical protein J0G95_15435 [Rhizobiales bacterium]|nr:hypothetical protein [Hyphomicrobiales bacterium]